jgi:hypothetical protein
MHTGPSNSDASVAGWGAILHLWRAALADPDDAASAQLQDSSIIPGAYGLQGSISDSVVACSMCTTRDVPYVRDHMWPLLQATALYCISSTYIGIKHVAQHTLCW